MQEQVGPLADYPHSGTEAEQWRFLIHYATLAPSERNTQPWLFRIQGSMSSLFVELLADRERAVHQVDPVDRELILSCGAALYQFWLTLRCCGHTGDIELFPEPDNVNLLARVRFGSVHEPAPGELALFAGIEKRHTYRQPFLDRSVDPALLKALRLAAERHEAWFLPIDDPAQRETIADLVAEADRILFGKPEFRKELAQWLHPEESDAPDGVSEARFGLPDAISYRPESFVANAEAGQLHADRDRNLALQAPVVAVLGTREDTERDWLQAGQALAAILLRAASEGLSASFLNGPIQDPELRVRLTTQLELQGFPQLMLRLGYGREIGGTLRRDVGSILLNERPIVPADAAGQE